MSGTAGFHCRPSSWISEGKAFEEGERKKTQRGAENHNDNQYTFVQGINFAFSANKIALVHSRSHG